MLEGSAHVEIGGEKFELMPGEMCFFPADEITAEAMRDAAAARAASTD